MSCNGWKHLKNYRLNDDFRARNIEMRDASRKKLEVHNEERIHLI